MILSKSANAAADVQQPNNDSSKQVMKRLISTEKKVYGNVPFTSLQGSYNAPLELNSR
jgi:hypothetical protein